MPVVCIHQPPCPPTPCDPGHPVYQQFRLQFTQFLTQKLLAYSELKHVNITPEEIWRAHCLMLELIVKELQTYCSQNPFTPLMRLEFVGSMYDGLKTEAPDELDVLLVFHASEAHVTVLDTCIAGYAFLQCRSPIVGISNLPGEFLLPGAILQLFACLLQEAVSNYYRKSPCPVFWLSIVDHGPAVQIDISFNSGGLNLLLLSVDLVPCFHIQGLCYVPKKYKGFAPWPGADFLWQVSSSLQEKQMVLNMDNGDYGCRRVLLKILKTIIKRDRFLCFMSSYILKHVFLHYNAIPQCWNLPNALGEHFLGFLCHLWGMLFRESIPHFCQQKVNLFEGIRQYARQMMDRCAVLINSDFERDQLLSI